jgi:hypothetical protein
VDTYHLSLCTDKEIVKAITDYGAKAVADLSSNLKSKFSMSGNADLNSVSENNVKEKGG